MREERSSTTHGTHWLGWTLALLASPLLYLLLLPPFFYAVAKDWKTGELKDPEPWLWHTAEPYRWISGNSRLGTPLNLYVKWWGEVFYGEAPVVYR